MNVPSPEGGSQIGTIGALERVGSWSDRFAGELDDGWKGAGRRFRRSESDLVTLFLRRSVEYADRVCLVDAGTGAALTYETVFQRCRRLAQAIAARGAGGARILVLGTVGLETALAICGSILAGSVVAVASERLSPPELDALCEEVRPSLVIGPDDWGQPDAGASGLPEVESVADLLAVDVGGRTWEPPSIPSPQSWAVLMPTGGSTGTPKIVVLTHENITQNLSFFRLGLQLRAPRALVATPLFHVTGLIAQLFHMIEVGGTCILLSPFSASSFVTAAEEYGATYSCLVPTMVRMITRQLEADRATLPAFDLLLYGGAAMDPATVDRVTKRLPKAQLINTYGATETTGSVTLMPSELRQEYPLSVGIPSPVASISFDATGLHQGAEEPLSGGIKGLITVRGSTTSPGYLRVTGDVARAATVDRYGKVASEDAWYSSDIGYWQRGLLYIEGRADDIINRAGEKIYPVEIERALLAQDAVSEAVAWGIADEILGSVVVAAVVVREGVGFDGEEVLKALRRSLSGHKIPSRLIAIGSMPRTPSGKVDKEALAKLI